MGRSNQRAGDAVRDAIKRVAEQDGTRSSIVRDQRAHTAKGETLSDDDLQREAVRLTNRITEWFRGELDPNGRLAPGTYTRTGLGIQAVIMVDDEERKHMTVKELDHDGARAVENTVFVTTWAEGRFAEVRSWHRGGWESAFAEPQIS